ncbi:MAG: succinylglutamate desuccinylase [Shewanellaceae bacterium]|nr:succinylglutamate desuccinylase [Shewanellaceae bacterium]
MRLLLAEHLNFFNYTLARPTELPSTLYLTHGEVLLHAAGVLEYIPDQPYHHCILISCGIHGNEMAPIEWCCQLIEDVLAENVLLQQRVQFQLGNLDAIAVQQRFVETNMNRLFDPKSCLAPLATDTSEIRRSKQLRQYTIKFFDQATTLGCSQYHFDLHTAIRASKQPLFAVLPWLGEQRYAPILFDFLKQSEIQAVLLSAQPTSTYSYFSSTLGVISATLELGQVQPFGTHDLTLIQAFTRTLTRWLTSAPLLEDMNAWQQLTLFQVSREIKKTSSTFKFKFPDDIANFSCFERGACLAEDASGKVVVEHDQEWIVFPNAGVPIGERAMLTLVRAHTDQLIST